MLLFGCPLGVDENFLGLKLQAAVNCLTQVLGTEPQSFLHKSSLLRSAEPSLQPPSLLLVFCLKTESHVAVSCLQAFYAVKDDLDLLIFLYLPP